MPTNNNRKDNQSPRQRARKSDGKFQGGTPENGEAWEPIESETALNKDIKYQIQPKIRPSGDAGPYSHKPKVRPTFGSVTTRSY